MFCSVKYCILFYMRLPFLGCTAQLQNQSYRRTCTAPAAYIACIPKFIFDYRMHWDYSHRANVKDNSDTDKEHTATSNTLLSLVYSWGIYWKVNLTILNHHSIFALGRQANWDKKLLKMLKACVSATVWTLMPLRHRRISQNYFVLVERCRSEW